MSSIDLEVFRPLLRLLDELKVMSLLEASSKTGLSPNQIQEFAHTHPDWILLFGGDCPVVCQAVDSQREFGQ